MEGTEGRAHPTHVQEWNAVEDRPSSLPHLLTIGGKSMPWRSDTRILWWLNPLHKCRLGTLSSSGWGEKSANKCRSWEGVNWWHDTGKLEKASKPLAKRETTRQNQAEHQGKDRQYQTGSGKLRNSENAGIKWNRDQGEELSCRAMGTAPKTKMQDYKKLPYTNKYTS